MAEGSTAAVARLKHGGIRQVSRGKYITAIGNMFPQVLSPPSEEEAALVCVVCGDWANSSTLNLQIIGPRRTSLMCALWTGHLRLRLPRDGCGFSMIFVMPMWVESRMVCLLWGSLFRPLTPIIMILQQRFQVCLYKPRQRCTVQCVEQYYSCAFV